MHLAGIEELIMKQNKSRMRGTPSSRALSGCLQALPLFPLDIPLILLLCMCSYTIRPSLPTFQ